MAAGLFAADAGILIAISHAEFVLAVCLFAAAICVYTHASELCFRCWSLQSP